MTRPIRATTGVLVAVTAVFVGACGRPGRPNILLIVVDTARADRFSTNGYARDTTPAIAALGREGAVYLRAYAPSPWTLPSHASLFTGLYPSSHGADSGHLRLDERLPFLARRLREAGYRTQAYVENPWVGKDYNFHPGFDTFDEVWRRVRGTEGDMGAGEVSGKVERWLAWRDQNDDARRRPFFIFINYFEPHLPYNPPEPERGRFLAAGGALGGRAAAAAPDVERLRRFKHPEEVRQILGAGSLGPDDFRTLSDLYDGEIAYVDRRIGEVVASLRGHGLIDETVVVVTSDHGEMLGEHGFMDHKFTLYEPVLRIPLVVRYPRAVPGGQRLDTPVLLQDLYPTLLGLAGAEGMADGAGDPGEGWPPDSFPLPGIPALASGAVPGPTQERPLIAEFARPGEFLEVLKGVAVGVDMSPWDRALVAFRVGETKLIWGSNGRHQLFDLGSDPAEAA
ncbi:MAG TPA: sulfatase, partial [Candidatus Cryosericum sp.]|nr:sulfatase [Candidatus Cryosericum sp.]